MKYAFSVSGNVMSENGADAMREILIEIEKLKKKFHITDMSVKQVD